MTQAGKKLQTVYDSGTEELSRLESDMLGRFKSLKDGHTERRRRDADGTSSRIESGKDELESQLDELKTELESQIELLEEDEAKKCREHADALLSEIKRVGETASESVSMLKSSFKEKLSDLHQELSLEIDAYLESLLKELRELQYEGKSEIRTRGTSLTSRIQKKLDQNLWEWKGSKRNLAGQVDKIYMDKASSIESHFVALLKSIQVAQQDSTKQLEDAMQGSRAAAVQETASALARAESIGSELERDINQFFGDRLQDHEREMNEELNLSLQDMDSTRETLGTSLETMADSLSQDLDTSSSEAQENLQEACQETKAKADDLHRDLLARLEERISTSKHARTELESTKSETIQSICDEIAELRNRFESSLSNLTREAESNIDSITSEVDEEIRGAHTRCSENLEEQGKKVRESIDREVSKVLKAIDDHKQTALSEIARAAGVDNSDR